MNRVAAGLYALLLVLTLFVGAVYIHEKPGFVANLRSVYEQLPFVDPCATPVRYTVGTIDERFGLSQEEVAADLQKAAQLWNDAAGKDVLAYAPEDASAIPVNFIYDKRQAVVDVGRQIDSLGAAQEAERAALDRDQQAFLEKQQSYASAIADFNAASRRYAAEVSRVNASGGADPATYERLNREQAALKARQAELDERGDALDREAAALKARIATFNAGVRDINTVVENFNETAGGDFEEGQYVVRGGEVWIDIYAYKSKTELLHTLAHEFGHALDIDHTEDPTSIMFPYNRDGVTLSDEDIRELKAVCRIS